MKKQEYTTASERKIKFAEAGVLFVLILALTIFIGVKVVTKGDGEEIVPAPVIVSETADRIEPVESLEPTVTAEAEHPDELAAEPVAVEVTEPEPRPVTYAEAENAFFDRRYDEAVELFTLYTDDHPANAWGYYMLGLSAWRAGDVAGAEEAFTAALTIKPDHVKSLINYGRVLVAQDRLEEAAGQIELALAAQPGSTAATRVQGRIRHNQGRLDEAAASYLAVLRIADQDVWSLNNLGLIRIQQGRYAEALPALAKAVRIDSTVACFQNNLGVALERTGHYTAAGEAYTAALAIDANYEKADVSLARVAEQTEAADLVPVDLVALADSFDAADDMEVAAAEPVFETIEEDEFPLENPAPARDDDDTPQD